MLDLNRRRRASGRDCEDTLLTNNDPVVDLVEARDLKDVGFGLHRVIIAKRHAAVGLTYAVCHKIFADTVLLFLLKQILVVLALFVEVVFRLGRILATR